MVKEFFLKITLLLNMYRFFSCYFTINTDQQFVYHNVLGSIIDLEMI